MLKRLRRTMGRITQHDLAELVGTSQATISRIERADNGDPPNTERDTLINLAELMAGRDDATKFLTAVGHPELVDELGEPATITFADFNTLMDRMDARLDIIETQIRMLRDDSAST